MSPCQRSVVEHAVRSRIDVQLITMTTSTISVINTTLSSSLPVRELQVAAYEIPTDQPESDGTLEWDSTTLVAVHVSAGDQTGFGYTYAPAATASLIQQKLQSVVVGHDAFDIIGCWHKMRATLRNAGQPGVTSTAISAIDVALWDLKAKLLDLPLVRLWGAVRPDVAVYGSGGFTSYTLERLRDQLSGWATEGIERVKMKVGRDPSADPRRVAAARSAIGNQVELFVDANGAYTRKQALRMAQVFATESGVTWFEEPVASDDLKGLRLLCERAPAGVDIAAGEYGYTSWYFRRMLESGAVDCLQADATRCGGFTGFFKASDVCESFNLPFSAHCGPQLHAHAGCCSEPLQHIEYFYDHVRIGEMLFDGALTAEQGRLAPDLTRPGHGLTLKEQDAEKFRTDF